MADLVRGGGKSAKNTNVYEKNESLSGKDIVIYTGIVEALDEDPTTGRIKVRVQEIDSGPRTTPAFCNKVNDEGTNTKQLKKVVNGLNTVSTISFNSQLGSIVNQQTDKLINSLGKSECNELPWCTPLIPLTIQSRPKIGEIVMVVIFDRKNPKLDRGWIGPIIPNVERLNFSNSTIAKSAMNSGYNIDSKKNYKQPNNLNNRNIKKVGDFTGGFPEPTDIALMSRNNADIIFPSLNDKQNDITKGGEVIIRAGKFKIRKKSTSNLELNDENVAYFRLKQLKKGFGNRQPDTHAMLFADYISIVSHMNGEEGTAPNIRKINPINELSTDQGIKAIHNSLSPMVRGDQLIIFLELLIDYVANHNHPYHKLPPTDANSKPDILKFDLNKILSTNIRIN